jgi:hypothetical protein
MTQDTVPAERGQESASTDGLRLGGVLWVLSSVACTGLLIVVFVGENLILVNPGLSTLVLGGATVALLTGGLLIARPGPGVARWSSVIGVAWLIAFGWLMVTAFSGPDADAFLSASLITGLGGTGALVVYRSGRSRRRLE